eukprot:TRINITY_DN89846_c0_g1_i1.p1 TRINITY_DN89846_c0_g1~~TRINITY_DN89846_c0_g1_i1.p1  ORF type:complete len:718 (+),score=96.82 TRINITY_DN89846_c0_g1_i1:87-2240(+)
MARVLKRCVTAMAQSQFPGHAGNTKQHVSKQQIAVVWYKVTDLRTHDHEPLNEAHASGLPVLHLFVFDPRWYRRTPLCKFPRTGPLRAKFQLEALSDLAGQLSKNGHRLCVRRGNSAEVFNEVCNDFSVQSVFASREVCSEELRVEQSVRDVLQRHRATLKLFWTFELHHYDDLPQWLQSKGSNSYTGYKQAFHQECRPRAPLGKPAYSRSKAVVWSKADELPNAVEELGLGPIPPQHPSAELVWVGGETAAFARVQEYLFDSDSLALDYVGSTNTPREGNSCTKVRAMSRLSPWLAHGCISPRTLFAEIKRYERERHKSSTTYWIVHEMYWRDFVRFQSYLVGNRIFKIGGLYNKHPSWPWSQDKALLHSWVDGATGFPFMDAAMREIGSTGYACHVGRETAAWFLICDLGLDWRMGAEWFESVLIDYEPAANWFCWVFVCLIRATGGNGFREVGHPQLPPLTRLQTVEVVFLSAQHDPEGEYIKRWIPELRHLPPGMATREPWRATGKPSVADSNRRSCEPSEGPDRVQMARRTLTSGGSSVAVWWSCARKTKGQLPGTSEKIVGWPGSYPLPLFPPASFFDIEKVADKARRQQAQKAIRVSNLRQALRGGHRVLEAIMETKKDAWDDADSFPGDSADDDFAPQAEGYAPATGNSTKQSKGKGKGRGKDRESIHIFTPEVINSEHSQAASPDETVRKRRWGRNSAQATDTPLAGM